MMAFQKVGYDGAWMFELAPADDWRAVLERAAAARGRRSSACCDSSSRHQRSRHLTMATHVYIERIGDHVGQTVTLKGWLVNRRSSGKIHFLLVRDGTGFLQVVMGRNDVGDETFARADHLGQESARRHHRRGAGGRSAPRAATS